ncbi:hypothetical protein V8F20_007027 [Naviculisporaceae sp. PSN 640]
MAESPISPSEFQRDFRATPLKREKDHDIKWSRGARPGAGVKMTWAGVLTTGSAEQQEVIRPRTKFSDSHRNFKREHNIVKPHGNWYMPNGRVRTKVYAQKEIEDSALSRSLAEMSLPPSPLRGLSASDNIFYSFDKPDSPGRPVTLDIFVKTTGRETERLIEREYEVINTKGESLRGKRARRDLRKTHADPNTSLGSEDDVIEDEGFEII